MASREKGQLQGPTWERRAYYRRAGMQFPAHPTLFCFFTMRQNTARRHRATAFGSNREPSAHTIHAIMLRSIEQKCTQAHGRNGRARQDRQDRGEATDALPPWPSNLAWSEQKQPPCHQDKSPLASSPDSMLDSMFNCWWPGIPCLSGAHLPQHLAGSFPRRQVLACLFASQDLDVSL